MTIALLCKMQTHGYRYCLHKLFREANLELSKLAILLLTFVLFATCPAIKPISAGPNASPWLLRLAPNAAAGFDAVELNTAGTIQLTQNKDYASNPLNYPPGIQNQYPANATAGQKITIITTVTSSACAVECVTDYNEVIVNILLPKTSVALSTAPASPAVNTVTAPATGGPWTLIVQVLWINYPTGGTIATFQTTMTIKIIGPSTISTVTPQSHHHHGHHHN